MERPRDEAAWARELIEQIVAECPERRSCSPDERRAQEIVQARLSAMGLAGELESFRFSPNLYANLALHFGTGVLGTVLSGLFPAAGLALHLLAGLSYRRDSTRRGYWLRRLLPWRESQNLVLTLPAEGDTALRLVFVAHADAALTGLMFHPRMVAGTNPERSGRPRGLLGRPLALATNTQLALAGFDLLRLLSGPFLPLTWLLRPAEWALTVPALAALLLNGEVVLRNRVVPGANDDLSGVAGALLLLARLLPDRPRDVELVFVISGAEEAGTGGGWALANSRVERWDPLKTVVLGLDGFSNGELRWFDEGEVVPVRTPPWLVEAMRTVVASDARFAGVKGFRIPAGSTDVAPFRARGFDGVTIGCVDPTIGAPRHYHLPSDRPENLDYGMIVEAVDFTERVVERILEIRLGQAAVRRGRLRVVAD